MKKKRNYMPFVNVALFVVVVLVLIRYLDWNAVSGSLEMSRLLSGSSDIEFNKWLNKYKLEEDLAKSTGKAKELLTPVDDFGLSDSISESLDSRQMFYYRYLFSFHNGMFRLYQNIENRNSEVADYWQSQESPSLDGIWQKIAGGDGTDDDAMDDEDDELAGEENGDPAGAQKTEDVD